jgi:2-oxoglutarate ferredoxin oxidoreductase subunit delta
MTEREPGLTETGKTTTTAEPQQQGEPREYEIDIFRDWCKSCGICAAFCPRQCLGLDEHGAPVVKDAKRCTGCRWCELHCPDFAICIKELVDEEKKAEEAD